MKRQCATCKLWKHIKEFSIQGRAKITPFKSCKSCVAQKEEKSNEIKKPF